MDCALIFRGVKVVLVIKNHSWETLSDFQQRLWHNGFYPFYYSNSSNYSNFSSETRTPPGTSPPLEELGEAVNRLTIPPFFSISSPLEELGEAVNRLTIPPFFSISSPLEELGETVNRLTTPPFFSTSPPSKGAWGDNSQGLVSHPYPPVSSHIPSFRLPKVKSKDFPRKVYIPL